MAPDYGHTHTEYNVSSVDFVVIVVRKVWVFVVAAAGMFLVKGSGARGRTIGESVRK
jgi:hypothetical protein